MLKDIDVAKDFLIITTLHDGQATHSDGQYTPHLLTVEFVKTNKPEQTRYHTLINKCHSTKEPYDLK